MATEIKPVPRIHGPNPPGLALVIVLFADQLLSTPEYFPAGKVDQDPVILEGSTAYAFFVSDMDASHDQDAKPGIYEQGIEFQYAAPEVEADDIFEQFHNREFVLLTTSLLGARKMIGTKEHPLSCRIRKSTGGQSGFYGYRLQFSGITLWPAPKFEGQLAAGTIPVPPADPQMIDFSQFDFSNYDFY